MGFYMLLPVLPLYLIDSFQTTSDRIGLVLACYTIAALAIRPFSGFVLDMFQRKPIYLTAYAGFVALFIGYPLAQSLVLFALLRMLHGLAFGMVTTAGNTLIVDIMPASRRGEGLGYFGIANNLAMAFGPMLGLLLHEATGSFQLMFYVAFACGLLGFSAASRIHVLTKPTFVREPLCLDRFFLLKGLRAGISLFLMGIPYGMMSTYLALYALELHITSNVGLFFTLMAAGLMLSRTFSGTWVDRGRLIQVIQVGILVVSFGFFLFSSPIWFRWISPQWHECCFFTSSAIIGIGYGMLFPAFNALFVNLAPNNRRATASSTYLTSWDVGIGFGLVLGGQVAAWGSVGLAYLLGALLALLSAAYFFHTVAPHYQYNKLH